jgi:hypothetical protein
VTIIDKSHFIDNHLPSCQCSSAFISDKKICAAALSHWLREVVQPNASVPSLSNNGKLVMQFDTYLKEIAGLAASTREYRRRYAYELLGWLETK